MKVRGGLLSKILLESRSKARETTIFEKKLKNLGLLQGNFLDFTFLTAWNVPILPGRSNLEYKLS